MFGLKRIVNGFFGTGVWVSACEYGRGEGCRAVLHKCKAGVATFVNVAKDLMSIEEATETGNGLWPLAPAKRHPQCDLARMHQL